MLNAPATHVQSTKESSTNSARQALKDETTGVVASVIEKSNSDKPKPKLKPISKTETVVLAHSRCDNRSSSKQSDNSQQNVIAKNALPVVNQSKIPTNIAFETTGKGPINAKAVCTSDDQSKGKNGSAKVINSCNDKYIKDANPSNQTHSGKRVENIILSKDELNESLSNEKDLPDELFGNFRLDQTPSESNPNTLSPTAAFLLSFPVVSTVSNSKPTETDNSYSVGSNLLRLDEKPSQPKDHCLFESISSILNDLTDVSDSKNVTNVNDNTHATSFVYCSNKNRASIDQSQKQSSTPLNDDACNGPRQKSHQKNLHINNLLSDDKEKFGQSSSTKQQSTHVPKKIDAAAAAVTTMTSKNSQMIANNPITNERNNFISSSKAYESPVATHSENASDFYVSLSTLGLPSKSTVALPPTTSINPNVGTHFNFQISSLAQPRNLIESRPLVADTPFTFSLTKNSNTSTTSNLTTKTTVTQASDAQYQMAGHRPNKTHKKTTPTKHLVNDRFVVPADPPIATLNRCNTFNPFSFDNPTMLTNPSSSIGLPNLSTVSSANSSIGTSFTFTLTPSFSTISTSTPLLSNHDPLFSSSFDMPLMRSTTTLTPKTPKKDKPLVPSYPSEKEPQSSSWKNSAKNYPAQPVKSNKNLVNWMTSSVNKSSQDLQLDFIPQVASHCVAIDEPSPWSPNRTIDNPGLISSSALPMLQGDLALNTMSNTGTATNALPAPPPPVNRLYETDSKKSTSRQSTNQSKYNMKSSISRKSDQNAQQVDHRSAKCSKPDKPSNHTFKSHHSTSSSSTRMPSESGPITNNFHSVSQLLDQERQTVNKNSYYIPNDGKMLVKDSNSAAVMTKSKYYPKYDMNTNNHHQMAENKYSINACNTMSSNGANSTGNGNHNNSIISSSSEIASNECDRDLFGGYFFGQSKRLKLNYHHASSGDLSSNQTAYDNTSANDLQSYVNYQSYDNDCNNIATNSCINNLTNQSYPYQYTQPQAYTHQSQQQPLNPCDSLDSSAYFQAPVSTLCSYKPPTFNDISRTDSKPVSTHQSPSFLHQPSKASSIITTSAAAPLITSNDHISNGKHSSSGSSTSHSNTTAIYPSQMPMNAVNRNASTCSMKNDPIHYPSHTNINHNLPLNQAWNDSFSWMPYTTNPIEKPYNNNLVFNPTVDTASNKTTTSNNIGLNNNNTNNTIPNFNLTTIFPDYNKS